MTDNFIAFFYRERLLVAVVSMLIVAGGILALRRLNVDAFPDVTPVQVEIDTEAEGLAPEEVERQIPFPIENEMNGIAGVTRVESICKFPRANAFAEMICAAGFARVNWQTLSGGIVALHSGWRL